MINELIQDLKRDEGFVPHVYQDHLGYWTLGYGFLVDERRGGRIPDEVAEYWLRWEVRKRREALLDRAPWIANQPADVQRALMNMSYQLGVPGLFAFRKMLGALQVPDRELAAQEAKDSKWYTQTLERAERVIALIRG